LIRENLSDFVFKASTSGRGGVDDFEPANEKQQKLKNNCYALFTFLFIKFKF